MEWHRGTEEEKNQYTRQVVFLEDRKQKQAKETTAWNEGLCMGCSGEVSYSVPLCSLGSQRGCKLGAGRANEKYQKWGIIEGWYTEQLTS